MVRNPMVDPWELDGCLFNDQDEKFEDDEEFEILAIVPLGENQNVREALSKALAVIEEGLF
jgi:hypothetical protein